METEPLNDYESRLLREKERFDAELCVHDLPDIFHYWSNKYLTPHINGFGYRNIEDFFVQEIAGLATAERPLQLASVGCGDCATEVQVAAGLVAAGVTRFHFTCMDISEGALERGRAIMAEAGLGDYFSTIAHDFNRGLSDGRYDAVMANQSLHHVMDLEQLFGSIRRQLAPGGCFLVSDMIGRNGHQRWPEARELVDAAWQWLPDSYRFNLQLQRQEQQFMDWDCSTEGFEGVRAQEVLPLLLQFFSPRVFMAWSNIVDVFIDRGFGHHFRRKSDWDLHFIDQVQALDAQALASGKLKPTHVLAKFQNEAGPCRHSPGMAPEQAVRRF